MWFGLSFSDTQVYWASTLFYKQHVKGTWIKPIKKCNDTQTEQTRDRQHRGKMQKEKTNKQTDPFEKPGHFELEKSVHSVQSKQITGKIDSQHIIIIILANTLLIEKISK